MRSSLQTSSLTKYISFLYIFCIFFYIFPYCIYLDRPKKKAQKRLCPFESIQSTSLRIYSRTMGLRDKESEDDMASSEEGIFKIRDEYLFKKPMRSFKK